MYLCMFAGRSTWSTSKMEISWRLIMSKKNNGPMLMDIHTNRAWVSIFPTRDGWRCGATDSFNRVIVQVELGDCHDNPLVI